MRPASRAPRAAAVLLSAGLTSAALCPDQGGFFPGPFVAPAETSTSKRVTLHLDAQRPTQRFAVALTMRPTSSSAHVDAIVLRANRTVRLELAPLGLDNANRDAWPAVSTGFAGSVFLDLVDTQEVVLSVGLDDPAFTDPADVDIDLVFACASDVDFDGVNDDVVAEIAPLEPLP